MASQRPTRAQHWLYNTYFNDLTLSDLTIKLSDGKKIHAHRIVLCRRSKYFAKLITGGFNVRMHEAFMCHGYADSLIRRLN